MFFLNFNKKHKKKRFYIYGLRREREVWSQPNVTFSAEKTSIITTSSVVASSSSVLSDASFEPFLPSSFSG